MKEIVLGLVSLGVAGGVAMWVVYSFWGDLLAAPFVPTEEKWLRKLFSEIKLKSGKTFWDLGSGDGRVVRFAVKEFGVKGVGMEINPWLVIYSRMLSKNAKFLRENFWKSDLGGADYIYFYLTPRAAEKLGKKLEKEKVKALIISKAFRIPNWEERLVKEVEIEGKRAFIYRQS